MFHLGLSFYGDPATLWPINIVTPWPLSVMWPLWPADLWLVDGLHVGGAVEEFLGVVLLPLLDPPQLLLDRLVFTLHLDALLSLVIALFPVSLYLHLEPRLFLVHTSPCLKCTKCLSVEKKHPNPYFSKRKLSCQNLLASR